MKRVVFIWLAILVFCNIYAQTPTTVKGLITDEQTNESVPMASVELMDTKVRVTSNMEGRYSISSTGQSKRIRVTCMGYQPEIRTIVLGKAQIINIKLKPMATALSEVVIKPTKRKYKNKDNPAVELIEKVIDHKPRNRKEGLDDYQYEKYEKTQFALSNLSEKYKQSRMFRKYKFVFDNVDSTKLAGSKILPLYIKETLSDYYYRKEPKATKEVIKANKMVTFPGYLDNQGMANYLNYMYQDINIYDNNISFLSNQFLSPIAGSAPTFYRYYLLDTSMIGGSKCVKLLFSPRNKTDMLFQGFMYITLDDSLYAVKKIDMSVNKDINLNWVKDVNIVQEFEKFNDKGWLVTTDEISMDFGLTKNGRGIYGQRTVSYKDYKVNEPQDENVYKGLSEVQLADANEKGNDYWETHRHMDLTKSEKGVYVAMDSIQKVPSFKRTMNLAMLVVSGYRNFGYFEVGPVNTFYSFNPIEGVRIRFGGRSTPLFSKKINFETYLAYGSKDKEYKYYLGTTYSLTNRSIYEFPVKSVKVSYQNETKIPGQELQFVQEDNILLSIKRGVNDKLLYNKTIKVEHLNEFPSHFSYTVGYNYVRQAPGGNLFFNPYDYMANEGKKDYINVSEAYAVLRYAPHEQFYQGKIYRTPIYNKYPIFQLQYTLGSKLLSNDYNYHSLKFSFTKRFYPSVLGYTDVIWETGKIFGKVPYPLMFIHRANQTYSYQITSYNLMNFLEFVSDQYTSLNVDHCFNGFIFNKLPLIKRLKLREVATFKVLYGSVSESNNPDLQPGLFKFPKDSEGNPITYTLEKQPYIEASVGISNIFRFFRVDVVRRFTYLDHPNVASIGIRARFKFDF